MRTYVGSNSSLNLSHPPQTRNSTYWGSVIAESQANDSLSRASFVAAGFDMWVVWSQIITELSRKTNVSNALTEIYLPDYDRHGFPSFRDTSPTDGEDDPTDSEDAPILLLKLTQIPSLDYFFGNGGSFDRVIQRSPGRLLGDVAT
jgi:hypothetical protein